MTVNLNTEKYPRQLAEALGRKAPGQLDCRGNLELLRTPAVGFSGSRKASPKGLEQAAIYARQLAREGWTVVSGHAGGVDLLVCCPQAVSSDPSAARTSCQWPLRPSTWLNSLS